MKEKTTGTHGIFYTADKTPVIDLTYGGNLLVALCDIEAAFSDHGNRIGSTRDRWLDHPRVWRIEQNAIRPGLYRFDIYQRSGAYGKDKEPANRPLLNWDYYATIEAAKGEDGTYRYELREEVEYKGREQGSYFILGRFDSFAAALTSLSLKGNSTRDERIPIEIYT